MHSEVAASRGEAQEACKWETSLCRTVDGGVVAASRPWGGEQQEDLGEESSMEASLGKARASAGKEDIAGDNCLAVKQMLLTS